MNWLRHLWRGLVRRFGRGPRPLRTVFTGELPDSPHAGEVYIVGESGHRWFAALLCPCGCGATLQLSLMPEGRPRWRMEEHRDGSISLHPSVWRTIGCRSHFFLTRGHVRWCPEDDPPPRNPARAASDAPQ